MSEDEKTNMRCVECSGGLVVVYLLKIDKDDDSGRSNIYLFQCVKCKRVVAETLEDETVYV